MGWAAAGLVALLMACAGCSSGPARAVASPPPAVAGDGFDAYAGAYRTDSGQLTLVINGHGHLAHLQDGFFRQLYKTARRDQLTFGPGFQVQDPKQGDVTFHFAGGRADTLIETAVGGAPLTARRLAFRETEVRIPARGATLAGTITEPLTAAPHPGVVILHGSGPGPRIDYGLWVGAYASLGLTVLAYDKRGNGASTGTYPGEFPTGDTLDVYAGDAAAGLSFLAAWPGVDSTRVGYHAGSQGAWVAPLAIPRGPAAWAILVSGPAITVGQQQVWASFSGGSRNLPTASPEEMNAAVRADHSGFDPLPALRAAGQPMLWINGAADRQVPTAVNTEVLRSLAKPRWELVVLPDTDHGMLVNPTGLTSGVDAATTLGPGLFDRIAAWLERTLSAR